MDANQKVNTIKHNQIEQKINELKNEPVYNDKKYILMKSYKIMKI